MVDNKFCWVENLEFVGKELDTFFKRLQWAESPP